jgi:hypothetical protein
LAIVEAAERFALMRFAAEMFRQSL